MRNRSIAFVGIVTLFLLALCSGVILLTGFVGWKSLKPANQSRVVKISMLPPLATPSLDTDGVITESLPAKPAGPVETEKPASMAEHFDQKAAPREAAPSPVEAVSAQVEKALGFALPAGAVNSVTGEGVATRLVIPKLNLDAPIVLAPIKNQTWQVDHLGQAVGHLEGTAPPGSNSNFVLAGHVTLAETNGGPGPFFKLSQLVPGDVLMIYKGEEQYEYVVDSFQTVDRTAIGVTLPTETPQITLITCTNWNKNEGRYTERLIVKGHLAKG